MLARAVASVLRQAHPVDAICIAVDHDRAGASITRNKAIQMALASAVDWIGFLDDDDVLLAHHTHQLLGCATEHEANLVWGWFEVAGGSDPFPDKRGRQWSADELSIVPIAYMVKADLLRAGMDATGGFQEDVAMSGSWQAQDMVLFEWLAANGTPYASPSSTWIWSHHASNTSGVPDRPDGTPRY